MTDGIVIFYFRLFFVPLTPLTALKKVLEQWKKQQQQQHQTGDIIIFHKCTKNHDHMLYCS